MRAPPALRTFLCLAAAPFAGCMPPDGPAPEPRNAPGSSTQVDEVDEVQVPIVGGTRQMSCQWPTAVGALGCTNTLVHPLVVTTANHCVTGGGPRAITFGETWSGAGVVRRVPVRRCFGSAGSGIRGDFGFCVLAEPVTDVPIVPILFGCETDILKPGQQATLVGYGRLSGTTNAAGTKFAVNVQVGRIMGNDIFLGNATSSACNGDSGGPAFVKLADGTWRVFGATSRGSARCNAATIYTMIHPFVAWMERTSGIDVTPCHDGDGRWNPGPACRNFPTNPEAANGAWQTMCNSVTRGGLGATCGAPFDGPVPDGGPVFPIPPDGGAIDARNPSDSRPADRAPPDTAPPDTAPPPPDAAPVLTVPPEIVPPAMPPAPPPTSMPRPAPPAAEPINPVPLEAGCACDLQGAGRSPGASALLLSLGVLGLTLRRRRRR
jgi:MYXO-CTERM domain-containing protein